MKNLLNWRKNGLLLFGLVFVGSLSYSMEYQPSEQKFDLNHHSLSGQHKKVEKLNDAKNEILCESNSLLTLPVEIIWHIMSFLTLDDSAYRHLRLYANLKLTEKQVNLILWKFYKKSLEKSDSISTLLEILDSRLNTLESSFGNYDNWLEGCIILKDRARQLADKFETIHSSVLINVKTRNFIEHKISLKKFVKDYSNKIKNLSSVETPEHEIDSSKSIFYKELYLILRELNSKMLFPVMVESAKYEGVYMVYVAACFVIPFLTLISVLLMPALRNYLETIIVQFYGYSGLILGGLIASANLLAIGVCVLIVKMVYSYSDYKPEIIDLITYKLEKIYRKNIKLPLLPDNELNEVYKGFFDRVSPYAKLWE